MRITQSQLRRIIKEEIDLIREEDSSNKGFYGVLDVSPLIGKPGQVRIDNITLTDKTDYLSKVFMTSGEGRVFQAGDLEIFDAKQEGNDYIAKLKVNQGMGGIELDLRIKPKT